MTNGSHNLRNRVNTIDKEKASKSSSLQAKKSTTSLRPSTTFTSRKSSTTKTHSLVTSKPASFSQRSSLSKVNTPPTSVSNSVKPALSNPPRLSNFATQQSDPGLPTKLQLLEDKLAALETSFDTLKEEHIRVQLVTLELLDLETKFKEAVDLCAQLKTDNVNLHLTVVELKSEVKQLTNQVNLLSQSPNNSDQRNSESERGSGTSAEQLNINSNVVIRGIDFSENAPDTELTAAYDKICSHLGLSSSEDFKPLGVSLILNPVGSRKNQSFRPLKVVLPSEKIKKQFLQVRRTKKEIYPADIGINQQHSRPILITEQLTRENQELLYQARSIRGSCGFKFVWTHNGQILVRRKVGDRVTRILDNNHLNQLKTELRLELHCNNGRSDTTTPVNYSSREAQV